MITIPFSIEDLTKVRIAPSPLWETVMSFRVLLRHGRHTMHAPWAIRATGAAWYRHLCAYRRDLHRVRLPVLLEPSFRLLGRYLRGGARALDGHADGGRTRGGGDVHTGGEGIVRPLARKGAAASDLPERPGRLPEAADRYAQALPRSNDRPLLAKDPGTPRGGHDKAWAGTRPWRRGSPPLQPASQGELQRGRPHAGEDLRGGRGARGTRD